jgi:hypothetical protein
VTTRRWLVIGGLAVLGLTIAWWPSNRAVDTPEATPARAAGAVSRSRIAPTLGPKAPAPRGAQLTAPPFDATTHHTADPCTAPGEAAIPTGFETVTAQGITVAWVPGDPTSPGPNHVPLAPVAIAHLVGGLLEEAAQVTGTARRTELTVIVYRSAEDLRTSTRVPSWAAGLYDGGAVRVFANPSEQLGISLSTLRHEIMHAQLHAAIGCMPFWLNEGLAEYISGPPPLRQWLELLRSPGSFELDALRNPALLDRELDARHVYGVSLAMVLYILEHGGQPGLHQALRTVHGADTERAIELWNTMYPRIDYPAVLDSLAHKVFGVPLDQLGGILDGALCCHGLSDVNELRCRATPTRTGTRLWFDTWSDLSAAPRAMCRNTW